MKSNKKILLPKITLKNSTNKNNSTTDNTKNKQNNKYNINNRQNKIFDILEPKEHKNILKKVQLNNNDKKQQEINKFELNRAFLLQNLINGIKIDKNDNKHQQIKQYNYDDKKKELFFDKKKDKQLFEYQTQLNNNLINFAKGNNEYDKNKDLNNNLALLSKDVKDAISFVEYFIENKNENLIKIIEDFAKKKQINKNEFNPINDVLYKNFLSFKKENLQELQKILNKNEEHTEGQKKYFQNVIYNLHQVSNYFLSLLEDYINNTSPTIDADVNKIILLSDIEGNAITTLIKLKKNNVIKKIEFEQQKDGYYKPMITINKDFQGQIGFVGDYTSSRYIHNREFLDIWEQLLENNNLVVNAVEGNHECDYGCGIDDLLLIEVEKQLGIKDNPYSLIRSKNRAYKLLVKTQQKYYKYLKNNNIEDPINSKEDIEKMLKLDADTLTFKKDDAKNDNLQKISYNTPILKHSFLYDEKSKSLYILVHNHHMYTLHDKIDYGKDLYINNNNNIVYRTYKNIKNDCFICKDKNGNLKQLPDNFNNDKQDAITVPIQFLNLFKENRVNTDLVVYYNSSIEKLPYFICEEQNETGFYKVGEQNDYTKLNNRDIEKHFSLEMINKVNTKDFAWFMDRIDKNINIKYYLENILPENLKTFYNLENNNKIENVYMITGHDYIEESIYKKDFLKKNIIPIDSYGLTASTILPQMHNALLCIDVNNQNKKQEKIHILDDIKKQKYNELYITNKLLSKNNSIQKITNKKIEQILNEGLKDDTKKIKKFHLQQSKELINQKNKNINEEESKDEKKKEETKFYLPYLKQYYNKYLYEDITNNNKKNIKKIPRLSKKNYNIPKYGENIWKK